MKHVLDFEKPVIELRDKITELKRLTEESEMDLSEEIATLEKRLENTKKMFTTEWLPGSGPNGKTP